MKRIVALILAGLLVAPPASADQKPPKPLTWEKAQKLRAGKEILLTIAGEQPTKVRFLFADDVTLVTRKPATSPLARNIEEALLQVGAKWPSIFEGYPLTIDRVRVSRDGIFDGGRKVADLADAVQRTPRADALSIADPSPSHVRRNLLIFAAVWGALTLFMVIVLAAEGEI